MSSSTASSNAPELAETRRRRRRGAAPPDPAAASQREKLRSFHRKALGKLEIPELASRGGGLTTPLGTRWTVVGFHPPSPVTAIHTQLVVPAIEVQATAERYVYDGATRWFVPSRTRCGSRISRADFQSFREALWKRGPSAFGKAHDADAFVNAVQLPRSPSVGGEGEEEDGRLVVRAVLRSKERAAVGLRRQFELGKLRASIPEPLPSPHSPNFDREALLSAVSASSSRRNSQDGVKLEETPHEDDNEAAAIPIHIAYARAHLPALAAIIMSNRVCRGDRIDLAVPHPSAWSETVGWVYTGEAELLTEPVRGNILYLGGRV